MGQYLLLGECGWPISKNYAVMMTCHIPIDCFGYGTNYNSHGLALNNAPYNYSFSPAIFNDGVYGYFPNQINRNMIIVDLRVIVRFVAMRFKTLFHDT